MNSKGRKQMSERDKKVAIADEDIIDDELVEDEEAMSVTDYEVCFVDDDRKKKVAGGGSGCGRRGSSREISPPICQAEKCGADLSDAKRYHRRHKVCEIHAKAAVVMVAGLRQRFCQQCSRFHEVTEFDETKRSCRRRLAGHNERRRKTTTTECYGGGGGGEGSHRRMVGGGQLKESQWRQPDERGRVQIVVPGNSTLKPFQIR